ncbi:MAG: hypothetical protein KatS3mg031_2946 [Chitinophagales bacterium]|nr:MAG: hypothetical protein KatS3mg031_2946 [Chitinophagales bacterium]
MIELKRKYHDGYTLGTLYVNDVEAAKTLELPWKENKRGISCIPEGNYHVTKEAPIPQHDGDKRKPRPYWHFRVHDVPGRSGILIHRITFVKDLRGCIGVASRLWDINRDGIPDALESGKKLQWLVDNLPDKFELKIRSL